MIVQDIKINFYKIFDDQRDKVYNNSIDIVSFGLINVNSKNIHIYTIRRCLFIKIRSLKYGTLTHFFLPI